MTIDQLCNLQLEWMQRARHMRGWMQKNAVQKIMYLDYLIKRNCEEAVAAEALIADHFEQQQPRHRYGLFVN